MEGERAASLWKWLELTHPHMSWHGLGSRVPANRCTIKHPCLSRYFATPGFQPHHVVDGLLDGRAVCVSHVTPPARTPKPPSSGSAPCSWRTASAGSHGP
jgi:hypothetical protein